MKVRKAIIPAAGLGTRMLPETKTVPKEMLPIVDKPAIQYVVEEAVNSGIEDILILTNRSKAVMEDYFDYHPELEEKLKRAGREEEAELMRKVADMANITFMRQKRTLGLGHAVLCAKSFAGNEPCAVLLGDDIMKNDIPVTAQLIEAAEKYGCSAVGARHVSLDVINKYCTLKYETMPNEKKYFKILDAIEKPRPEQVYSDFAILGRYVLTPGIYDELERVPAGYGGEIQLTDGIAKLAQNEQVIAVDFDGRRFDTGGINGYLETVLEYALENSKTSEFLKNYILAKAEEFK